MLEKSCLSPVAGRAVGADRRTGAAPASPSPFADPRPCAGTPSRLKASLHWLLATGLLVASATMAEFAPDPPNRNESLPSAYPKDWLVVHDAAFFHMREGRFLFVDPNADTVGGQFRGMVSGDFIASYQQSALRNEHYVIETFFSRGGRGGERTDVVTIYDPASLEVSGEIIIPPKRLTSMPEPFGSALVDEDRLLVVYNFTPSQSLSVVDLEQRAFVAEHPIAGCALAIPTGQTGVTSICSDGAFLTTTLSDGGAAAAAVRSKAIPNAVDDPIFEKAGIVDGVAYFPTFAGNILPVDLSGEVAVPQESWSALTAAEREAGWRPGGWRLVVADRSGRLYLLMHPDGREGSHKDGGNEVWVFDPRAKKRLKTIALAGWGISIAASNGAKPVLVVTNGDLQLETYDTETGQKLKTLAVGVQTPFIVHGVR